jgi:hypothetical protein
MDVGSGAGLFQGYMAAGDVLSFGTYRLVPAQRLLLRGEKTIDVGSRALHILIALAQAVGEVVGAAVTAPLGFGNGWGQVVHQAADGSRSPVKHVVWFPQGRQGAGSSAPTALI